MKVRFDSKGGGRIVGHSRIEETDLEDDRPRVLEVVVHQHSLDEERVSVGDASAGMHYPYSRTLADLTVEEAEQLHELLGVVLADARCRGWIAETVSA
jgi:hypothetical protein